MLILKNAVVAHNIFYSRLFKNSFIKCCSVKSYSKSLIFGIETSCDDTGCAIIDDNGQLLSEKLYCQNLVHLRNGGIIPDVAQDLHRRYIEPTVNDTLEQANVYMEDISAIAVTLQPGLPLSLAIGMKYAKHLSRKFNKPLIPIHHMEAHALVARMEHGISFPYLTLLISGGHCLLAVVEDVNKFMLLGQSMDLAPGEVFDKVSRRMKLRNIPEYSKMSGGQAVEVAASKATNPHMFKLPLPLVEYKDCNFSFNGLKTATTLNLFRKEREHKIEADGLIPEVNDLCAALLMAISRHLVHRTQRAIEFCRQRNLIPMDKGQLVVSGGVACNNFIFKNLNVLCDEVGYKIYRPSSKLCTDNGVMIAWNGLEKWKRGIDIVTDLYSLDLKAVSPLGENLIPEVCEAKIPMKLLKIKMKTYLFFLFNLKHSS
ncbi:probable tRNA N6-adenosine threonylcarbamoyltransferase, mitochondrial [Colias croceus]|uniref:probable tRNA N6-adenosine threonylcarbamoyltransferase, mitochondrial n=1 Tax=Colias crocea TaxID=72248 RepID=UPI001E280DDA|nr:probable tRNA N6-adenosine threonylcarbamoyltransferase, mitochondrial [Colias croceus]